MNQYSKKAHNKRINSETQSGAFSAIALSVLNVVFSEALYALGSGYARRCVWQSKNVPILVMKGIPSPDLRTPPEAN